VPHPRYGALIDAVTGAHIWAHRYHRKLEDIFAVQNEITSAVTSAIGPAIVDAERQRAIRNLPESLGESMSTSLCEMATT
jgi:adenylate cyclase